MRSRDNDPFFTVDIPILRIRRCTPAEAAARAERWARSRALKLRRRLEAGVRTERHAGRQAAAEAGIGAAPEPLPPWHEVAAAWQRVRASYGGLFQSDEEEEQARIAFHRGGARWRAFLAALNERKRDRASLAVKRR